MASGATIHHIEVALSDVDRGVYESLDLRVAQHPSESLRFMLTRTLGYCLSYEEGISFSKNGIADTDEPAISIKDPTGIFLAWIDIGAPAAERLHKATKAARSVTIYTHAELAQLRKEAATKAIHKVDTISVYRFEPAFLDSILENMDRKSKIEITRNDGQIYIGVGGETFETPLPVHSLVNAS